IFLLFILPPSPPPPTPFPYTTLFRSSRRIRLLGGLILWVSTAYYAVVNQTGKGRGRAGPGLYPELAVLGIHHGKTAALPVWLTRSEEHTSELQSLAYLVCRLLLEKKK